jgi:hypothetical protein
VATHPNIYTKSRLYHVECSVAWYCAKTKTIRSHVRVLQAPHSKVPSLQPSVTGVTALLSRLPQPSFALYHFPHPGIYERSASMH